MSTDRSHRPVRVIALMNQKGGVGKTTTTVNLAAGLADIGRSTLVVDLDPQAHATLHTGTDPASSETSGTVYDILLEEGVDPHTCVRAVGDNLSIIASETDLAAAESELAGATDRHARLHDAIEQLAGEYEFILLDCPPSLGLLTLNALAAAQEVIIPMQAHFLALQGVSKLLETVKLVREKINPDLRVAGVVLCMHDQQATHVKEVVADLEEFFEQSRDAGEPWSAARLYHPPVRRNIKLAECPSFGQTIFEYAPWAPGALDYRKLAETIAAEWDRALDAASESAAIDRVDRPEPGPPTGAEEDPHAEQTDLSDAEIKVLRGEVARVNSGREGAA